MNTLIFTRNEKFRNEIIRHTSSAGRNICKGIRLASKHWRESSVEDTKKFSNLEKDIMNAFSHYLGVHDACAKYYCDKKTDTAAHKVLKVLKETGLNYKVLDLCQQYFGNNARSLIAGYSTNRTEGFNSLIAKYLGKFFFFQ